MSRRRPRRAPSAALLPPPPGRRAPRVAGRAADALHRLFLRSLLHRNPFATVGPAEDTALRGAFERLLDDLRDALGSARGRTARVAAALAAHRTRLRRAVASIDRAQRLDRDGFVLRVVPWSEHDPRVQFEVLGLDSAALVPPVLDLGCGPSGALVRRLRAAGIDAVGLDRVAVDEPPFIAADWLEFPLAPAAWGTVISHLGFSLHFLHHHLRPGGEAARHARRYMEILRSLRPGGAFVYAPSLPFVEAHLPADAWRVEYRPLELPPPSRPLPPDAAEALGRAARVTRIG